jgi:hypothetical protein
VLALLPYTNLVRRFDAGQLIERIAPFAAVVPAFDLGRGRLPAMRRVVENMLDGK